MDHSGGGFVDLRDLAKRYQSHERSKVARSRAVFDNHRRPSEESDASFRSLGAGSEVWESLSVSPGRSEGFYTPCTPQTPADLSTQTPTWLQQKSCQTKASPLVSRYNRLHPNAVRLGSSQTLQIITSECPSPMTWSCNIEKASPRPTSPVELAGSLLLPSQGYPQSFPPVTPPRPTGRSHSDPTASRQECARSAVNMAKKSPSRHEDNGTSPAEMQRLEAVPRPPRLSSLPSTTGTPHHSPPPIPLSQMTMEELMQILPRLDAAVIAVDWIPCMQRRHRELKSWLQKGGKNVAQTDGAKNLEKDLRHVVDESRDIARTYYELFDIARGLQDEELQKKTDQLEDSRIQQSEAVIALARHVGKYNEKCAEYERRIQDIEDNAQNTVSTLYRFIKQNFDEAIQKGKEESIRDIMNVLVQDPIHPSTHVRREIYERTQEALRTVSDERDESKEICLQQSQHIRKQSEELDRYISRLSEMLGIVQAKEGKIAKLQARLKAFTEVNLEIPHSLRPGKMENSQETPVVLGDSISLADSDGGDPPWVRDAEILNLRRKLEKAYDRENELNKQVRQLLQNGQKDREGKQPGMLKRFLINHGPQKSTMALPSANSMHDLNPTALMPYNRVKISVHPPASPNLVDKLSPLLQPVSEARASTEQIDQEVLAIDTGLHFSLKRPSLQSPSTPVSTDDDINSAITQRFHQMPSNIQSIASTPQPDTIQRNSDRSPFQRPDGSAKHLPLRYAEDATDFRFSGHEDDSNEDRELIGQHHRVLSGITEVTEGSSSTKTVRKSSSAGSFDRQVYMDSVHALERM